ncbi:MAG: hypothetical protein HQL37_08265 [Alphaproteobacteria bacterium]|nr:hypothetical protein [Alphaproteobacteria bacterium]
MVCWAESVFELDDELDELDEFDGEVGPELAAAGLKPGEIASVATREVAQVARIAGRRCLTKFAFFIIISRFVVI